jgi:hypothetical protein
MLFATLESSAQRFAACPVCFSQDTCVWAGVDSVWEQEKLEARKMLVNRTDSPPSAARGVGQFFIKEV